MQILGMNGNSLKDKGGTLYASCGQRSNGI